MKNLKNGLLVLLIIALFLSVLTGCDGGASVNNIDDNNESIITDDNKWVLIAENQIFYISSLLDEYEERKTEYGYDEFGRLNYKKYTYGNEHFDYYWNDFEYDNNGNVISCTETGDEEGDWYCTFTYDENNNCLSYTKTRESSGSKATINHTFTYDNNGNILTETDDELYEYKSGDFSRETFTTKYNLNYENGLCVQAEVNVQGEESDEEMSYPFSNDYLELYMYDANGNRINKKKYYETTGNYHIEVNGKYYYLSENIEYTWKQLGELNDSSTTNNESNARNGFPEPLSLKQVTTDGKTSLKERPYHLTVDSLYMISDIDGYNYLVLTYTVRNQLINSKVETGIGSINLVQNDENLDRYFDLSDECKVAYSDIISDDWVPDELRPDETRTETMIFEIYDTESDITLKIAPNYYYGDAPEKLILQQYAFS